MKKLQGMAGFALVGLIGCTQSVGGQDQPATAEDLRSVDIDEAFTFQTNRTVDVQLDARSADFGENPDAPVEVRTDSGAVLFRGAVRKGAQLDLAVSAPANTRQLEVSVGGTQQVIAVEADRAAARVD